MKSKIVNYKEKLTFKTKQIILFSVAFVLAFSSLSIVTPKNSTYADPAPGNSNPEPVFDITYDFNGGTINDGGNIVGTKTEHSVAVGMELSEANLIDNMGVTPPENQVLNYITVNDVPYNLGDGHFLHENITIKYFWRDYTTVTYQVNLDPNGGTIVNYGIQGAIPAGQTFALYGPDPADVIPPQDQEFDAFEINGTRYEEGSIFTITQDSTCKLLWKEATTPAFDPTDYAKVEIGGNGINNIAEDNGTATISYTNGTVTVTSNDVHIDANMTDHNTYSIYSLGETVVTANPVGGFSAELWEDGTNLHVATKTYNNLAQNDFYRLDADFTEITNTETANIAISAGSGTYQDNVENPQTHEIEQVEKNYDDMADFYINGAMWDHNTTAITYPTNPTDQTVDFTFETIWNERYYENIVINNVSYNVSEYLDFEDRDAWLDANHGTMVVAFTIPGVAKSSSYGIVVKHGHNNHGSFFSTFLWTADPAQADGENYIGHSRLEFVKAEYEVKGQEYTVTAEELAAASHREGDFNTATSPDGYMSYGTMADVNYDDGNLTVPGNARVTMRVVPEYGYQVTSVNGGGEFTTTDEGVSEFTVVLPEGVAGYFHAEVTAVDDEVVATSDKVTGGTITLADGEINAGTVRLSVEDVELSADKIKDFDDAAGDDYRIKTFLDINLSQVLYKGTADDVWEDQIHQLNNEAIITLQLEEGIDVDDIVIVHNINDGDEFEIIEIDSYDPVTRTITFRTSSFSNYAIALRTDTESSESSSVTQATSPETGAMTSEGKSASSAMPSLGIIAIFSLFIIFLGVKRKI